MDDTKELSSHSFPQIYEQLDIDVQDLGCLMLEVEPLEILRYVPGGKDDLYFSDSDQHKYVAGAVGEEVAHVTLLYGLLKSAKEYKPQIDQVLQGWQPGSITVDEVNYFDSHHGDEPYYCIVANLVVTSELLDAHTRLSFLPHINTFQTYQPHISLAYIKKDQDLLEKWLKHLSGWFTGRQLNAKELNYGRE